MSVALANSNASAPADMLHDAPAPGYYAKIPNYTGLYRHTVTGKYYAIKKLHGKRRERGLGTTDRKLAERRLRDWVASLERVDGEVEKTTIAELKQKLIAINIGKSESSQYIVRSVIEEFESDHGPAMQVRNIRPSHVEEWLARREARLKNTSYNRIAGVIRAFFDIAANDRIIVESPFERVKTKWKRPEPPLRRIPTMEQFNAILASIRVQPSTHYGNETADFIQFLGLAGLGQAEAASLTWGDVDWQHDRMHIRRHKTGKRFTVPIYPDLRPFLEKLLTKAGKKAVPTARVFKIKDGKKALTNACARLGYPRFTQRNLRQFHVVRLLRAGVSVKLTSKWQGHRDGGKLIMDTYSEVLGMDDGEFERQQLAKLGPPTPQTSSGQTNGTPLKRKTPAVKFSGMDNPFKADDKVVTKIKGADVETTVAQVFNNEVQVKTGDGKLLWRTMFTIWYPGASPIPKPEKPKAQAATEPAAVVTPQPAESSAQTVTAPSVEPAPKETAPAPATTETSKAGEAAPVASESKGRKQRMRRSPRAK